MFWQMNGSTTLTGSAEAYPFSPIIFGQLQSDLYGAGIFRSD
jgi:hypothetical protein